MNDEPAQKSADRSASILERLVSGFRKLRKAVNRATPNWMQWRVDIEVERKKLWYKCCYSFKKQEFSRRRAYHLGTIDVTIVGPSLDR